jgi:hypothetical protein
MSNYNGREPSSHVYEWCDSTGTRFVGWGTIGMDGSYPWQRKWAGRADDLSPLGAWLQSLSAMPSLSWQWLPSVALPRSCAAQLVAIRRRQLRAAGVRLLAGRCYAAPPGKPEPLVLGGVSYPSIRAASRITGIPRTSLLRKVGLYRGKR